MTKQRLELICSKNPENLGAATPQGYLFKYIDISSVDKGCIHWSQVNSFKYSDAPSRARRRIRKDDILLCTVRPGLQAHARIGKEEIIPFVASTGFAVLRPNNREDSSFLYHQIFSNSVVAQLRAREVGSNYPAVNESDVRQITVFMPEPAQRRNIGKILDTIDEAIAKTDAVIAKLKQVRSGLLHDLLSYGLDDNGRLRDPITHPEQFKDSPLGRIPREWETKPLGTLCNHIGSGLTPRGGQDVYTQEGILFIRSQNVTFEGLKLGDIAYIPKHIHLGMLRSEVLGHDVLFNITGASIGRCCPMPDGMGQSNVNQHVCILRVSEATEADALFLSTVLSSTIGQKQLEALNTCGNRQGLNYQQLGSFIVPWPQAEERGLIADYIKKTAQHLSKENSELEKLNSLKSGLQDDLLTGRVRVPESIKEGAAGA